jgi:glycosyltransferase involved in cell wall biosynthesis
MAVAESLAHGVPALVTAGTGAEEALGLSAAGGRGLAGAAGDLRDPAALAAMLRTWLTDGDQRDAFSAAARAARPLLPTWADTAAAVARAVDLRV